MIFNGLPVSRAVVNTASSGDNTIVSAVAGQKIYVYAGWLWSNGTVSCTTKDGAGTSLHGAISMVAQSTILWDFNVAREPWFVTTAGNALILNLSGAVQVSGQYFYVQTV